MSDAYHSYPLIFASKGIIARYVDDRAPEGTYLNLNSMEEVEENGLASRLGTRIINRSGAAINALPSAVYSLSKLTGLGGTAYRYAGSNGNLYRRQSLSSGPYAQIASGMSGNQWVSVIQDPVSTSYPYIFIADANGMLKDNGALSAPQQMGIFQPQYPVMAQAQPPDQVNLDTYTGSSGGYTYGGIGGGTIATYVNTTTTGTVATGIQTVNVAAPSQIGLFQLLAIDSGANAETVLVIALVGSGFTAKFTKSHATGATVTNQALSVTVPASTTATVSKSFGGNPIGGFPTLLGQEDYIGIYLYVSDPSQIQQITLKFGVANDSTFTVDYFYKVIGQGPLQSLLNTNTESSVAAADVITAESLGIFQSGSSGITALNTGLNQWTPILIQLSDFAGAGRANFNDPTFNWYNVNGYELQIVTNDNASVTVEMSSLVLFGGFGPDSLGGVAYDYLFTFYNINDGTESNPSMFMTNVNPPSNTYWITPRRQGVLLTLTYPTLDPQSTHLRVYRRGGGLGDNFRRIDQVAITASPQKYLDVWTDAQISAGDLVSLTNDVPVTSSLVVPVNTTLTGPVGIGLQSITPVSMANISVSQQINLGNVAADNYETVIVLSVSGVNFTAYVQNTHVAGENVEATGSYGQPVTIMATAFDQMYFAGDPNNPNYLYFGPKGNPQVCGSTSYVPVGTPDDTITCIVATRSNLFVSTLKRWWAVAPGSNAGSPPTVYPTAADRGCVALQGACVKGEDVFYQALDGIRVFRGGSSEYITQGIEFIWQGIGKTPIVQADQTQLSHTVMTFWNNMVFISYVGVDGFRHRIIWHTIYQRWRNDDLDVQSILLEADTNTLVFGDSQGLIRQDRVNIPYDEANVAGQLFNAPIPCNLQTPFDDQRDPTVQKVYQEFTLDANTNGQDADVTLEFNDGQSGITIGTVNTTTRKRVNLNINAGEGFTAYKCSLVVTGSFSERVFLYQAKIRAIPLAQTRQSYDTWWQDDGTPESKVCKQLYVDYNASAAITMQVFYDYSSKPGFVYTLPLYNGVRNSLRVRLPAVKYRLRRVIMVSGGNDFQVWDSSGAEVKPLCQGKGYEKLPLMAVEK